MSKSKNNLPNAGVVVNPPSDELSALSIGAPIPLNEEAAKILEQQNPAEKVMKIGHPEPLAPPVEPKANDQHILPTVPVPPDDLKPLELPKVKEGELMPGVSLDGLSEAEIASIRAKIEEARNKHEWRTKPVAAPEKLPDVGSDADTKKVTAGVFDPDAPEGGTWIAPWDGDPEAEILPGELVYYWWPGQRGLLAPKVMYILAQNPNGSYKGVLFEPVNGGYYVKEATRPSVKPKQGCITPRKRFNLADLKNDAPVHRVF